MKVLLDECVTRYLKRDFPGHEVFTVEQAGLKGLKNGELLQTASGQYDVLVTVDQNLQYQQNLKTIAIAIVILAGKRNTYGALKPLIPEVLEILKKIKAGDLVIVKA